MSEYIQKHANALKIDPNMEDSNGRKAIDIWNKKKLEVQLKKQREEEKKLIRRENKKKKQDEKKKEKLEAIRREEEMESILKKQKIEKIKQDLESSNRNGFIFVFCLILFFVFAYLFIKFRIEYNRDYIIDSKKIVDI